jgi:hypothetical protein
VKANWVLQPTKQAVYKFNMGRKTVWKLTVLSLKVWAYFKNQRGTGNYHLNAMVSLWMIYFEWKSTWTESEVFINSNHYLRFII